MQKIPKVLLAFDFGLKRIGVAVGQTVTLSARPLKTLTAKKGVPSKEIIAQLIKQWQPDALVVGIPLSLQGEELSVTTNARDFASWLQETFQLPVHQIDERLTTKSARETLFNQGGYKALQDGQVDSVAAQLILQNWFAEVIENKK